MTGSLLTANQVTELLGLPKTWVYEQSRALRILNLTIGRRGERRGVAVRPAGARSA